MTIAARLSSDGIFYTNGSFDEVTNTSNGITPTTVYTSELDEIEIQGGGVAKRETSDGKLLVSKNFDELSGVISVDSSLLVWLDSGYSASYPGSGSTWTDLTGGNNATLISSPSYISSNGGIIRFNSGSSQYATMSDLGTLSNFTLESWVKFVTVPTINLFPAIIANTFTGIPNTLNFSLGFNGVNGSGAWNGRLCGGFYNGTWRNTLGFVPQANVWYNVAVTYDGTNIIFYNNGAEDSRLNYAGNPTSSGHGIRIARRWDDTNYINGYVPIVKIYNRALTASEVLENYNTTKNRFAIV